MIGRADIEGSKSNVAMNAWLPRASLSLLVNIFYDTSCIKLVKSKGSIGPAFAVRIHTENQDQASFLPFCSTRVLKALPLSICYYHQRSAPGAAPGGLTPGPFQRPATATLLTHLRRKLPREALP
ncbi:hypothetical protein JTE90_023998 [Oedothorax gibbosus]|uniref:Uncharacterized protein n=1 Tax=Oedothorax gibbosus TaxID=931172 RepID=A0AAV6TIA9_9ARAC|nr:hypothetical protein JTE90_023998 [Oedothorax gibbosus]